MRCRDSRSTKCRKTSYRDDSIRQFSIQPPYIFFLIM